MQIPCPGCGKQLPISDELLGKQIRCGGCHVVVDVPHPPAERNPTSTGVFPSTPLPLPRSNKTAAASIAPVPIDHPYPVQPKRQPTNNKNTPIIITAVSCLFGLVLVIGTTIVAESLLDNPPGAKLEPVQQESDSVNGERVEFQEGYSMVLPVGCKQESREETELGDIVYRFRSEEGFGLTFAIIPDESIDRFSTPPKKIRQAFVKGVPELDLDIDVEVQPKHMTVNGMRAVLFRFYEQEVYRGIRFTYLMVVLDKGRKLVLNFAGKHGDDKSITWPQPWYDSLVTLRSEGDAKKPS